MVKVVTGASYFPSAFAVSSHEQEAQVTGCRTCGLQAMWFQEPPKAEDPILYRADAGRCDGVLYVY